MDFIFMLTHHDKTVPNCLEIIDEIADLGLTHIGFKDVGADVETLAELTRRIKRSGATAYVEVVSTTPDSIRNSMTAAAKLGVDRVLGGQDVDFASTVLKECEYFPFPGKPLGHPTKLHGSPSDVEEHCRKYRKSGCPGVDLLAYRAVDSDPLDLIRAARRGLGPDGHLIVAGSIDTPQRIRAVEAAGANGFTIGSAIFDGSFAPGIKGVRQQCKAVLEALGN